MKRRPFLGLLGLLALAAAPGPAVPFPHLPGRQTGLDYRSAFLAVGLSHLAPAFSVFTVDSLGRGRLDQNPALPATEPVAGLALEDRTYEIHGQPVWQVSWSERTLILRSDYAVGVEAPAFTLTFDQKANHATLLGLMKPGERRMSLPCVFHLPDLGTVRITGPGSLEYDASRRAKPAFVRIAFPPATAERRRVAYRLEVTSIHPKPPGLERDPRYDGFRRDWLNIFQVNPHVQMLANNAASDPCAFTLFLYSDLAAHTPPLADGRSRDWRDWRGGCHGYEGLLVDNYHALLAVLDDVKAKR